jgi:hypothetical protein
VRGDALLDEVVYGGVEAFCTAGGYGYGGAGFAERFGDLQAEATAAAGDQRDLVIQAEGIQNTHQFGSV